MSFIKTLLRYVCTLLPQSLTANRQSVEVIFQPSRTHVSKKWEKRSSTVFEKSSKDIRFWLNELRSLIVFVVAQFTHFHPLNIIYLSISHFVGHIIVQFASILLAMQRRANSL